MNVLGCALPACKWHSGLSAFECVSIYNDHIGLSNNINRLRCEKTITMEAQHLWWLHGNGYFDSRLTWLNQREMDNGRYAQATYLYQKLEQLGFLHWTLTAFYSVEDICTRKKTCMLSYSSKWTCTSIILYTFLSTCYGNIIRKLILHWNAQDGNYLNDKSWQTRLQYFTKFTSCTAS